MQIFLFKLYLSCLRLVLDRIKKVFGDVLFYYLGPKTKRKSPSQGANLVNVIIPRLFV